MKEKITNQKLAHNVVVSLIAQIISLSVSFLINLIVPKFIDEYQYSYWQMYTLYVGYVGVLHFGLLDGIVLRYAQYDYDELDKKRIRSQFQVLLLLTSICAASTILIASLTLGQTLQTVAIFVAVGMVTKNIVTYTSYSFQITNRINKYVILTIVQRVVFGVFIFALLLAGVKEFYWYCCAEIIGDLIAFIFGTILNRGLYFGRVISLCEILKETWKNISSGFMLLVANWSSMLLIGGAKMIVQWRWDPLLFGKVSFAFSLSNLFLTFISAISIILFPALKRINGEELPQLYAKIRDILSPLLIVALLFYFPGSLLLQLWLPTYTESLTYLGVLLPIIIYSSKVTLLTNTYLKAYRKEKIMLLINVVTAFLGVMLFLICAYLLDNVIALLVSVVLVILLNSIFSEVMVSRIIKANFYKEFIIEAIMTIIFIVAVGTLPFEIAGWGYLTAVIAYCIFNAKKLRQFIKRFLHRRKQ